MLYAIAMGQIKTELLSRNGLDDSLLTQSRGQKWNYRGKELWNVQVLSRKWKSEGVMDEKNGESKQKEVIGAGIMS